MVCKAVGEVEQVFSEIGLTPGRMIHHENLSQCRDLAVEEADLGAAPWR